MTGTDLPLIRVPEFSVFDILFDTHLPRYLLRDVVYNNTDRLHIPVAYKFYNMV